MFGRISIAELIIILLIVLLVFGAAKLPAIGRSLGRAIKEFKKGAKEMENDLNDTSGSSS